MIKRDLGDVLGPLFLLMIIRGLWKKVFNRFALEAIAKSLDVEGMLFEGEYRFTKQMVADLVLKL